MHPTIQTQPEHGWTMWGGGRGVPLNKMQIADYRICSKMHSGNCSQMTPVTILPVDA